MILNYDLTHAFVVIRLEQNLVGGLIVDLMTALEEASEREVGEATFLSTRFVFFEEPNEMVLVITNPRVVMVPKAHRHLVESALLRLFASNTFSETVPIRLM